MSKPILILLVLLLACPAAAETPDSPFYLGGGAGFQMLNGTGTWSGYEFAMDGNLTLDEGATVGFGWADRAIVGLRPFVGYRFGENFALQVGFDANVSKSATESYAETNGNVTYEQGYTGEWTQRSLEVLAVMHPDPELNYSLYAGWKRIHVNMDILLFESAGGIGGDGISDTAAVTQSEVDTKDVNGFVLGAGYEFGSGKGKGGLVASVQYTFAKSGGAFFGTPDFEVDLGGFAMMAGFVWRPFTPGAQD